jgi:KaiC/GvpD/RAD55 family RecA-like ATPase
VSASTYYTLTDLEGRVAEQLANPPEGIRIPAWPGLHDLVGGWRMHELTLLPSGTGTGKTTLLANLASHLNALTVGCYIASVEIGAVAFLLSMLSVLSGRNLTLGEKYSPEVVEEVRRHWLPMFRNARLLFSRHDDRVSPEVLCQEIEEAHTKYGVRFVILDNLQFFSQVVEQERERAEQDRVIREFVRLVKKLPIHVFLIVHTRKTNNDNQRVESLADMKGSKTLADEAWNVIALNKPKTEDLENNRSLPSDREILALKLRFRGQNVGRSVRFVFKNGRYIDQSREVRL